MKNKRYNFNKGVSLDKICSVDELRPNLNNVYFKDGFAIASDCSILVKAKIREISNFTELDILKLEGKFLRRDLFKMLVKHDIVSIVDDGFMVYNPMYSFKLLFSELCKYPNVDAVFPKDHSGLESICIDPNKLNMMCSSICAERTTMKFGNSCHSGIEIKFGAKFPESIGLLMPCISDDD